MKKENIKQLLLAAADAGRGDLSRGSDGLMKCELDQEDVDAIFWARWWYLDKAEMYERGLIALTSRKEPITPRELVRLHENEMKELVLADALELFTRRELAEIWCTHKGYDWFVQDERDKQSREDFLDRLPL